MQIRLQICLQNHLKKGNLQTELQTRNVRQEAKKNMTEETFKDICLCGETTMVQFELNFTSQKEIAFIEKPIKPME